MRLARLLVPVALVAALVACGDDDDGATATSTTEAEASSQEVSAEVIAIDAEARTITVDLIDLLTGDEALEEWEAQGGDDGGPPNDYVIRDDEDTEVTYDVAEDATITIVEMGEGVEEGVDATLEELVAAHEATPFTVRLVVEGDVVTEIHQRFTP